jgi:hypothetical protein
MQSKTRVLLAAAKFKEVQILAQNFMHICTHFEYETNLRLSFDDDGAG